MLAITGLLVLSAWAEPPEQARAARPNVVLVMVDDMRLDALWVMPTVQQLAERGVSFQQFFITTPLCCPSRASLLSGQYAHKHRVLTNEPPRGGLERFDDHSTLATWLQATAVRTALVGKYLNGYASEAIPVGWDYWFAMWEAYGQGGRAYYDYNVTDNGRRRYYGRARSDYSTRVLTEQALRFLESEREQPFLLLLTPRAPHSPSTPDHEDTGTYKHAELPLPPSYNEGDVSDKPERIRRLPLLGTKALQEIEVSRRLHLETLLAVDRMIAAVLDALRTDGRLDQTWVIFTSDNGLTMGEHRLAKGKSCPYEECVRVPLIVVPPGGLPSPAVDNHLAANIDLAPTIAEIFGVAPPEGVDGRSLLPLLADPAAIWRDEVLLERYTASGDDSSDTVENGDFVFLAVRTASHKYVRYATGEDELYDLTIDPYELESLARDPSLAALKAELAERLTRLAPPASTRTVGLSPLGASPP